MLKIGLFVERDAYDNNEKNCDFLFAVRIVVSVCLKYCIAQKKNAEEHLKTIFLPSQSLFPLRDVNIRLSQCINMYNVIVCLENC